MTKVYVRRNGEGKIFDVCWADQPGQGYQEMNESDAEVVAFLNPAPPAVTIVYQVDLWSRVSDAEADQIMAAMATQPVRIQNIFRSANEYHSTHELWPLLQSMAVQLFGSERAAEILAPSI